MTTTTGSTVLKQALDLYGPVLSGNLSFDENPGSDSKESKPKVQPADYARPTGEVYVSRVITVGSSQFEDVGFIKQAYNARMPVLLYGAPGTGKTALIEAALEDVVTVQGTAETEVADFVGSWTQSPDGKYVWVDGPLIEAGESGKPLLIDEIALVDPRVMAVVYGLMDGRDKLVVTANPDRADVEAKDGFVVFGSCNPDVPGAIMSDALLSRFMVHVEVKTDWTTVASLGVDKKIMTVARNLQTKKDSGQITASPQVRELLTFQKVKKEFGADFALANFIASARPEDQHIYVETATSIFGESPEALVF